MIFNKKIAVMMASGMLFLGGCSASSQLETTSEAVSEEVESEDLIDVSEDGVITQPYEVKDKKYIRAGRDEQGFMTVPGDFSRVTGNQDVEKNKAIQFADPTKQNKVTWAKVDTSATPDLTTEDIANKLLETYSQLEITQDQVEAGKVDKADMLLNPIVVVLKKPDQHILTLFFQDPDEPKAMYTIAIEGSKEFVDEYTQLIFTWKKLG